MEGLFSGVLVEAEPTGPGPGRIVAVDSSVSGSIHDVTPEDPGLATAAFLLDCDNPYVHVAIDDSGLGRIARANVISSPGVELEPNRLSRGRVSLKERNHQVELTRATRDLSLSGHKTYPLCMFPIQGGNEPSYQLSLTT